LSRIKSFHDLSHTATQPFRIDKSSLVNSNLLEPFVFFANGIGQPQRLTLTTHNGLILVKQPLCDLKLSNFSDSRERSAAEGSVNTG
jgi:hypothetical protein